MNDQTFLQETAEQWIRMIESGDTSVREQDLYPLLSGWVAKASPERILEIGCGQGVCSDKLDLNGRSYVGVDPSPWLIERARELYESERRRFVRGNAYGLPFLNDQFDGVFSAMVWHLLCDLEKAASEMSRVLKPGGEFLIVTANPDAYSEWADLYANTRMEGRRFEGDLRKEGQTLDHDVLYLHTLEEIVRSLTEAGFEVGSIEPFRKSRLGQGREYLLSIQGRLDPAGTKTNLSRNLCNLREISM